MKQWEWLCVKRQQEAQPTIRILYSVSVRLEAVTRLRFATPGASSHDGHLQEELQTWKKHHDRLSDSFYMAEQLQLSAKKNRFFLFKIFIFPPLDSAAQGGCTTAPPPASDVLGYWCPLLHISWEFWLSLRNTEHFYEIQTLTAVTIDITVYLSTFRRKIPRLFSGRNSNFEFFLLLLTAIQKHLSSPSVAPPPHSVPWPDCVYIMLIFKKASRRQETSVCLPCSVENFSELSTPVRMHDIYFSSLCSTSVYIKIL